MADQGRSGTATVLFTDVVGSTELLARLGDRRYDELRRSHFAALRGAIDRQAGEEIKTLGDGILAVFSSAGQALDCAVAMQQMVDRVSRSGSEPVAIRVGVALGDVAFEEADVFGAPVVEAARLVAAAQGGQILATTLVRAVAGTRTGVRFMDLGAIDLKGLPEPVAVCEVAWDPLPVSIPLPPFLAPGGRIFVGRHHELARLEGMWKEASAGDRRVALLGGEPGVGKTRLAIELARVVHDLGATVVAGRCDEDLGVPYQPFVESVRHYVDGAPDTVRRLGRYGGELTRLVPELADLCPDLASPLRSDPETERYRLFEAVAAWLADLSAGSPVLLVLDDLHWAAKPTLLMLRHILRFPDALRLLVLITYRDSDIGRSHPLSELLADLRRVDGVERLALSGLDQAAVAAFIEAAAGHALSARDERLTQAVWAETEGNPFFVAEVLRHLVETGGVEHREGRWATTVPVEQLGIPEGIRDVVGQRLSRLSDAANGTLTVASVIGLEFELDVLTPASDLAGEAVLTALDEAVGARLLSEVPGRTPRCRFSHALVRATLYDEISAGRRVTLHRKVAAAIETVHAGDLDDHLPALAHHWARASAPAADVGRAVDYARRAGDRAVVQLAHDEAVAFYRQALDLLAAGGGAADGDVRQELLIVLGEAERRAGDAAYRQTLLSAASLAAERGDAEALVRAALANSPVLLFAGVGQVDEERIATVERALESVGPHDSARRARLLASLGLELFWARDRERRVALSSEALAIARRLCDPAVLADVLLARFYTIAGPTTVAERAAETAELVAVVDQLGDDMARSRALVPRFRVAMEIGDVVEAGRCFEANARLAADLGLPALRWVVTLHRAGRALLAGRIGDAETAVYDIEKLGRAAGQPDSFGQSVMVRWQVRFEQGRLAELEGDFLEAIRQAPIPALQGLLAGLYCEAGRLDEARRVFEAAAEAGFDFPSDIIWLRGMTECAAVCARLGDLPRAEILHDLLAPCADQFATAVYGAVVSGSVAHYLGMLAAVLGRFEAGQRHFAAAAEAHQRIGAPTWLARTRLEWARMLTARRQPGDDEMARGLLLQALATARELGLANVELQSADLLP